MKKFTFKTIKPTGKWRSFDNDYHVIKLDKKECGQIVDNKPFSIRFTVIKDDINEDGNTNCEWKWIQFSKKSETLKEAQEFLSTNIEAIIKKYNIRLRDK
jgi:hypothetical protein